MIFLPRKTAATIVCFALFIIPMARRNHAAFLASVLDFQPRTLPTAPEPVRPTRTAVPQAVPAAAPSFAQLADPDAALEPFYKSLRRTEAKLGITRILHYGDSPTTADSITSDLRSLLQERFGDAGHGFVLIAKPWAWYNHHGADIRASGWRSAPATQGDRAGDGLHGLGGVTFEAARGAWSTVQLDSDHDRVEVSFLYQPRGGVFAIKTGNQTLGTVNSVAPAFKSGWATFPLPPHTREVKLEVVTGPVRLFGMSFEKGSRGLIYNSLGLNGGQVQVLVRYFDPAHWTEQLQHQRPDLVIVNYGTNESVFAKYLDTTYPGELREVIHRIKAAVPDASVLVMSPMDRGQRLGGTISTMPTVPHIVEIQRQIALEEGCAFFNTFEAMGGAGTMARWYASQPQLVTSDFIHPFPAGAQKIGRLLDGALVSGYERFKQAQMAAPARLQAAKRLPAGPGH
jgi:lysophospholipase L1-like esterase